MNYIKLKMWHLVKKILPVYQSILEHYRILQNIQERGIEISVMYFYILLSNTCYLFIQMHHFIYHKTKNKSFFYIYQSINHI